MVQGFLDELKKAVNEKRYGDLDDLTKKVTDAWYPIATNLYAQNPGQ